MKPNSGGAALLSQCLVKSYKPSRDTAVSQGAVKRVNRPTYNPLNMKLHSPCKEACLLLSRSISTPGIATSRRGEVFLKETVTWDSSHLLTPRLQKSNLSGQSGCPIP